MLFKMEKNGYPHGESVVYLTGREHEDGFWGGDNVLFYDLGIGYMGVKFVKI